MGIKNSVSNIATIAAVIGASTISSAILLYFLRGKLEDKEAFNALMSQMTVIAIPITKLTFFDLSENHSQDIIAIEEKYKVRVKLQLGSLPDSGNESITISGFKKHADSAVSEVKCLVTEVSKIVNYHLWLPRHIARTIDLEKLLAGYDNQNYDLNAVVNKSVANQQNGSNSSEEEKQFLELYLTGTQSQVNFTQGLIVSSAESFYQHNFAVPDCVDRPKGAIYDVYVSAVKSADQFWVQIVDETANSLDELQDTLCSEATNLLPLTSDVISVVCAAPYIEDPSSYYRARVISYDTNSECDVSSRLCWVEYLDYGDQSQVLYKHLRELKAEFCSLPAQAVECCLFGVSRDGQNFPPNTANCSSDDTSEVEKFKCFTHFNEWIPVKMVIVDNQKNDEQKLKLIVKLFDKNTNLEITRSLIKS